MVEVTSKVLLFVVLRESVSPSFPSALGRILVIRCIVLYA